MTNHRFLCDEMLHRLGRWLRGAGYDTAIASGGADDAAVLGHAITDRRLLLTRDRGIGERRGAAGTVLLLQADDVAGQACELSRRLRLDWLSNAFTRCLVCNVPVREADAGEAAAAPASVHARALPVRICPSCRRLYWPGGHEERLRKAYEELDAVRRGGGCRG